VSANPLFFRASSVGKLMTKPRAAGAVLSEGAKTYIRELAAQEIFGVDFEIGGKELDKGIEMEGEAIAMLNRVLGLSLTKNTERRNDGLLSGECDLFEPARRRGFDLKCPWTSKTFPLCEADCEDSIYEWQARAYCRLYDADEWTVAYALVNTPEHLIPRWENAALHVVDHHPERMRLTTWTIKRDLAKEREMLDKLVHARVYLKEVIAEFDRSHRPMVAA
jgi:hypothetical protein